MEGTTRNELRRKREFMKVIGIITLALLVLVSIAGAAPFAYVVNGGGPEGSGGSFSVIDTATNKVTATVSGNLEGPGVAVNPTGTKVYITNIGKNTVSVIDTATNKVTATVSVGTGPYGVAVSPDGKKVYVTNGDSNTVSVIDTATNKVTATVPVGTGPSGVAVSPDGKKVYVTNGDSNTVSVIDVATNKITATVSVGNGPLGVAVTPDGKKIYVANSESSSVSEDGAIKDGTVSVIDTATNKVTATVTVGSSFYDNGPENPCEVVVTPNGKNVYVTCDGGTSNCIVSVIDTATNKVTTNLNLDFFPKGIAVTPDGKKVYVPTEGHTGTGYGTVVIDTATNEFTDYILNGFMNKAFGQFIGPSSASQLKPAAAFTASPTSGTNPLKVQFTDQSTNSPTSWKWDFGDGSATSTTHNPLHTYIKEGSHTVTLTATNAAGSGSVTKTNYITVTGTTPTSKLIDSGTWKGNGTYYNGQSQFDMNLTINVQGNTFSGTLEEVIYNGIMLVNGTVGNLSSFSSSDQERLNTVINKYGTGIGKFIVFTDPTRIKGTIAADCTYYAVVNADGSLQGIWAYPGTTSSSGDGTLSLKRINETAPIKPVAAFTASPTSGTNPLKVQFTDQSANSPTSWKWDFGDGSATSTTHNPLHTYIKAGTHTVTFTATNAAGSSTVTKTKYITVK